MSQSVTLVHISTAISNKSDLASCSQEVESSQHLKNCGYFTLRKRGLSDPDLGLLLHFAMFALTPPSLALCRVPRARSHARHLRRPSPSSSSQSPSLMAALSSLPRPADDPHIQYYGICIVGVSSARLQSTFRNCLICVLSWVPAHNDMQPLEPHQRPEMVFSSSSLVPLVIIFICAISRCLFDSSFSCLHAPLRSGELCKCRCSMTEQRWCRAALALRKV